MSQQDIEEELKKKMKSHKASEKEDDADEKDDEKDEKDDDEKDEMPFMKKKKKEKDDDMKEETLAAKSLSPKGAPGEPMSKIGMISQVTSAMSGMPKSDMINFFNQVMGQFGPGKDYGIGDKSGHNQDSIDMKTGKGPKTKDAMPKLNVKEDIDGMFDGEDLSEEFKEKASTLFEAALNARVTAEVVRIEEELENTLKEQMESFAAEVTDKLDTYLDYVVENWMAENEVAIESTLRNEISEQFIEDLKNLFAENYMNVPEEKVNVIEKLTDKIEALETRLDETITENHELKGVLTESTKKDLIDLVSSDLTLTQQEKFLSFAEGIEFDGDVDTYQRKLEIIKENYFSTATVPQTNLEEETYEGEETSTRTVSMDPSIARYVSALNKTVKR